MRWLALVVLVGVMCAGCAGGTDSGAAKTGEAITSMTTGVVSSPAPVPGTVVPVAGGPVGLAVDSHGDVWVARSGDSRISRVRSGHVDLDVSGVDVPLRVAVDDDSVWATAFGTGELVRIATATGAVTARIPVGKGAEGVAVGLGSVWVVAQDEGRLVRVDPKTAAVVGSADIGVGARLVTTGGGAVWVSHYANGSVLRIEPSTMAVTASPRVCSGPQGIVATAETVWVACTTDTVLLRLDPATWAVAARVETPEAPDALAAGPDGRLRLVAQQGPTLVVVDPLTGSVVSQQVLGNLPQLFDRANVDVAIAADATWVSSFSGDAVHRLGGG